jgi:ketosteroid isomerase-like protein
MSWLPAGFQHPERVELPTGHHLRPIRESDADIDHPAVMGSRERLWRRYGTAWGWPRATMSFDADREDLARHEAEIAAHESFNYAVLDEGETRLLGCVYIDPPEPSSPPGTDAVASWWVVDEEAGGELERALDDVVPRWLADVWGFRAVHLFPAAGPPDGPGAVAAALADAMNAHDIEAFVALFAADYDSRQPAHPDRAFRGREQVRANWSAVFEGVPDFRAELVAVATTADTAWTEWRWDGTHADGSRLEMAGVIVLGVHDGQIAWGRLYVEPVEQAGGGIDAAVDEMSRGG